MYGLILTLLAVVFLGQISAQNPSPCPEVFAYETRTKEEDRWYGVISLRTPEDLSGVWVHVTLDRPAELLGNWFGEATSSDNQEYTIKNPKYHLEAGPPVTLRFFVKYNAASTIPSVIAIRLNGKNICGGSSPTSTGRPQLHISQVRPTNNGNSGHTNTNQGTIVTSANTNNARPNRNNNNNKRPTSSNGNQNGGGTNSYETVDRPSSRPTNNYDSSSDSRPSSRPIGSTNYDNTASSNGHSVNNGNERPSSNNYNPNRPSVDETYLSVGSNTDTAYPNNAVERPSRPSSHNNNNNNRHTNSGSSFATSSSSFGTANTREPSYGEDSDTISTGTGLGHTGGHVTTTDDYDFFPGDFALSLPVNRPVSARPSVLPTRKPTCGTIAYRPSPLITYGQNTSEGQWPWHAALYHSQGIQLTYTCGASLLSEHYVITAAHCVTKPQTNKAINPQNLLVYLGKHNLKKFGSHIQDIEVEKITVHPNYNSTVFHNDVAMLKLGHAAEITNYVRPVCLWEESTDLNSILNRLGTVVGWGFDQNRKITNDLMQASMPIVQSLDCVYSNPDFFSRFTFDKSYCAGFRNGTSVCNGDSGGGMVFPKPGTSGHNTVWQLRGLVSVGVALQGQTVCDTSHYIVFTDVAKHLEWIRSVMNQN